MLVALGVFGCATAPRRPPLAPAVLDAARIQGTWHVIATTLPMWIEGPRKEPAFTYSNLRTEDGRVRFDDTVTFVRDGEAGHIDGLDTQHDEVSTRFRWRGRGWLTPFTSDWDFVALDPENGRWAVITFEATLFTPAGLDVIAREAALDTATLDAIVAHLGADPALATFLPQIVTLPR